MPKLPPFVHLRCAGQSVLLDLRRDLAELLWLGAALPAAEDLAALCDVARRGCHESQADNPVARSLLPQTAGGYPGTPALVLLRNSRALQTALTLEDAHTNADSFRLVYRDKALSIGLDITWRITASGIVESLATVRNTGSEPVVIAGLASLSLPLPHRLRHVSRYAGRWSAEMREDTFRIPRGMVGAQSFGGRAGFGGGQWLRLEEDQVSETRGLVLGAHLAWSGDHELLLEKDNEGGALLMLGARLESGEIELAAGMHYSTPPALFCLTEHGRAGLRQAFHAHAMQEVLPAASRTLPRKVHLNTWEAVGFAMQPAALQQLVADAAALGVERFVLDDGWFLGRRDDSTSLGDWSPDPDLFPDGLGALIAQVHAAGMDFGLWVEPEMASPDSDLLRAHPDWCLHLAGEARPTQRHQLVLDLTQAAVSDYLFDRLDTLLRENAISYLKWDHNRELFPLAGRGHAQTLGLLALLDRLRRAHPGVEIESCASGGGRVDFGILHRTERFWASDNNDPLERLRINRGWLQFLPLRALGNHVGPSPNPVTGRRVDMDFRAKVALFGHMGVEADPARMSADERSCLAAHIALYKAWRGVLHGGRLFALESSVAGLHGWFAWDGRRGLALAAQTALADDFDVAPVRLPGLDPAARYRICLPEPWPGKASRYLANATRWREGVVLSGLALAAQGLALPLAHPENAWLIAVELQA